MIRSREKLIDQRVRSEKKKNEERHTLEKLQAGKKTMKSIFSTKSNADQMNAYATSITKVFSYYQQLERDIEALEEINQIVTVYIAKTVIPKLKKDKMQAYYKIIKKFSSIQSEQATAVGLANSLAERDMDTNPLIDESETLLNISVKFKRLRCFFKQLKFVVFFSLFFSFVFFCFQ